MSLNLAFPGMRTGFPFAIKTKNELGDPVQVWDGSTRHNGHPSGSSSQYVQVVGPGVPFYGFGFSLSEFAALYYRVKGFRLVAQFAHTFDYDLTIFVDTASYVGNPPFPTKRRDISNWDETSLLTREVELFSPFSLPSVPRVLDAGNAPVATETSVGYWTGDSRSGDAGLYAASLHIDYLPTIRATDGKFYPIVNVTVIAGAGGYFTPPPGLGCSTTFVLHADSHTIPVSLCGVVAPAHLLNGAIGSFGTIINSGTSSGSGVVIEPAEYWTWGGRYDPDTGLPV